MPVIQSPRILRLQSDIQGEANGIGAAGSNAGSNAVGALQTFWSEVQRQGAPIIEPGADGNLLVTFLWRDDGAARSVAVIQDWGADGIREHFMTRLARSDVWYLTRSLPSDTRTTYQLSPSGSPDRSQPAPYQPDPLNPSIFNAYLSEGGSPIRFSLLELPAAPALPWRQKGSPKAGAVRLHRPFADQRRLWVYMPASRSTAPLPMLLVFDGLLYKNQVKLPEILDYLIERGDIPPTAALLMDNADRGELLCSREFARYTANDVTDWFRAAYPVTMDPRQTVVLGSSYGGLAAVYQAHQHPQIFGKVLSQSGWFRWRPDGDPAHHWLARQMAVSPTAPPLAAVQFWLQVGSLEVAQMADGGPTQLEANRHLRDTLAAKGYAVEYQEFSGGHDTIGFEAALAQALVEILR